MASYAPSYPDIIHDPLWFLMLSTNDCHPGCGCDGDVFHITEERIAVWMSTHSLELALKALDQLTMLYTDTALDLDSLVVQTNVNFVDVEEARGWLGEWKEQITKCIQNKERL